MAGFARGSWIFKYALVVSASVKKVFDDWRERKIDYAFEQVVYQLGSLPAIRSCTQLEAVQNRDNLRLGGRSIREQLL